jgi:hypothetical protein
MNSLSVALGAKIGGFDHPSLETSECSKLLVAKNLTIELGGQNIPANTDL